MTTSATIVEIAKALAKAQTELKNPNKNKTVNVRTQQGGTYTYKYADLADILDQVKPILAKNGLTIVQGVVDDTEDQRIKIDTLLLHESGEWIKTILSMPQAHETRMNPAQALGSLLTYGRRYAITSLLNLASDEDNDANTPEPKLAPTAVGSAKNEAFRGAWQEKVVAKCDFCGASGKFHKPGCPNGESSPAKPLVHSPSPSPEIIE